MSSEGDTSKNLSSESNEKSLDNTDESSQDSQDVEYSKPSKTVENNKENRKSEDKEIKRDSASKEEEKPKEVEKKEDKKDVKDEEEDTENSEKSEDEMSDKEESKEPVKKGAKGVPLLDQPLEKSGKRERKSVQRFANEAPPEKETKMEIPKGSGTQLGEIPRVDASISRFKGDDLKLLHKVLYKTVAKSTIVKKNIRQFCGFDFKKDSEEYTKKMASLQKIETKHLKSICEMLDLPKTGNKDDICERILSFLMEPVDSGKPVGGGRPKRSAAVKANNRGYSSHDDHSGDEKPSRASRDKGKRSNLKDESSSDSDEEFHPSDSDEKPRVNKRRRSLKKKKSEEDEQSDEALESPATSEDSDDEPKNKRKKVVKANNKAKTKTPAKRGRKPGSSATPKKTPAKSTSSSSSSNKKKAKESSSEDEQSEKEKDDGSSSEDEPLAKKVKGNNPPTDDEIKEYIKEVLKDANLEEITMKNVCQQVYAHYPEFDLTHKKDFIKTTVKSLIST